MYPEKLFISAFKSLTMSSTFRVPLDALLGVVNVAVPSLAKVKSKASAETLILNVLPDCVTLKLSPTLQPLPPFLRMTLAVYLDL